VAEAIQKHYPKQLATSISEAELQALEALFYEYMSIYESHWRDDPKFDLTNTRAALPNLPSPKMTAEVLMSISRYPVERNFIAPRHERPAAACNVGEHLQPLLATPSSSGDATPVALQVTGAGGGQWQLHVSGGRVTSAELGLPTPVAAGFHLSAATFGSLASGELSIDESINSGRLVVQGTSQRLGELKSALQQVISARAAEHRTPQPLKA
jgi:hypothetical protein